MGLKKLLALFEDPPASAPAYDPVHLGAATLGSLIVIGLMYWLLWTLLVYEGGLFSRGTEGKFGNVCALLLLGGLLAGLHRLYFAAKRHASRPR